MDATTKVFAGMAVLSTCISACDEPIQSTPPPPESNTYTIVSAACETGFSDSNPSPGGTVTIEFSGVDSGTCTADFIFSDSYLDPGPDQSCEDSKTESISSSTLAITAAPACAAGTAILDGVLTVNITCNTANNAEPVVSTFTASCANF